MFALVQILLAFVVTSALLIALFRALLPAGPS